MPYIAEKFLVVFTHRKVVKKCHTQCSKMVQKMLNMHHEKIFNGNYQ
uniref:Uncharacterized protein n=1 Tax=Klebsiella pneumoniae TaxID=573 RepID=A0A3G4RIJ5_KLEPN|nr:hypothetical protein [Klebsiella pneumoniae]AZZ88160.1 hypothetical protein [Klebsiella pneumoniae]